MTIKLNITSDMTLQQLAIAIVNTIPKQILVNDADRFQTDKEAQDICDESKIIPCCGWTMVHEYMSGSQFEPVKTILTIVINDVLNFRSSLDYPDLGYLITKRIRWTYDYLEDEIIKVLQRRYNTPESIKILREEVARGQECRVHQVN